MDPKVSASSKKRESLVAEIQRREARPEASPRSLRRLRLVLRVIDGKESAYAVAKSISEEDGTKSVSARSVQRWVEKFRYWNVWSLLGQYEKSEARVRLNELAVNWSKSSRALERQLYREFQGTPHDIPSPRTCQRVLRNVRQSALQK